MFTNKNSKLVKTTSKSSSTPPPNERDVKDWVERGDFISIENAIISCNITGVLKNRGHHYEEMSRFMDTAISNRVSCLWNFCKIFLAHYKYIGGGICQFQKGGLCTPRRRIRIILGFRCSFFLINGFLNIALKVPKRRPVQRAHHYEEINLCIFNAVCNSLCSWSAVSQNHFLLLKLFFRSKKTTS